MENFKISVLIKERKSPFETLVAINFQHIQKAQKILEETAKWKF